MNNTNGGGSLLKPQNGRNCIRLLVAVVCFIICIPAMSNYLPVGMDMTFHLSRINGIAYGLAEGQFPVRMHFSFLNGYGYPVSVCYGDLLLYFPALLRLAGLDVQASYLAFIVALNIIATVIAFYSFKTIFRSEWLGLLGCALWMLAPYHIVDVWFRAAVGESCAMAFIPLLMLGIFLIFTKDASIVNSKGKYGFLWLALGGAAIVYSHTLSVIICLLLLIPAVIAGLVYNHSKRAIVQIALATVVFLLLSAAFLIPFLDYYLNKTVAITDITTQKSSDYAANHALQPAQLFLVFTDFTGRSAAIGDGSAGEMPFGIGLSFMMVLVLWVLSRFAPSKRNAVKNNQSGVGWLLFAGAVVFMIMTTWIFPWNWGAASNPMGFIMGKIASIQFPWRLVLLVLVCLVGIAPIAIRRLAENSRTQAVVAFSVLLCVALVEGCISITNYYHVAGAYKGAIPEESSDKGISTGEYLPSKAWKNKAVDESTGDLIVNGDVEASDYERRNLTATVEVSSGESGGEIVLPLSYYPNYSIVSKAETGLYLKPQEETRFMTLVVPSNYKGKVAIEYIVPSSWTIALWITYITAGVLVVCMLAVFLLNKKRIKPDGRPLPNSVSVEGSTENQE